MVKFILLGVSVMAYKIKYDGDADVLTDILREKVELSHAEEVGDIIVHFDEDGSPFLWRYLEPAR